MANKQGKAGAKSRPEWEMRASQLAQRFGLSDAEVKREIKRALIRLIAEKIAGDEVNKWQASEPQPEVDLGVAEAGAERRRSEGQRVKLSGLVK